MTQVNEMYKRLFTRSKVAASDLLVETTWADLFMKTENGQLIPGQMYRITDYTLIIEEGRTIGGEEFGVQIASAGKRFDVVVMALSERKLSESAFAMNNASHDDFPNNNLCAWELRYSLYNDSKRFDWACSPAYNPQSVIDARIQDDIAQVTLNGGRSILMHVNRNDGEYEMFYSLEEDTYYYTLEGVEEEETFYTKVPYPVAGDSVYVPTQDGMHALTIQSIQWNLCPQGKGVIYRMVDEFDNDLPYDFKNLMSSYTSHAKTVIEAALEITLPELQYTFGGVDLESETPGPVTDTSTLGLISKVKIVPYNEYNLDPDNNRVINTQTLCINLFFNSPSNNVEIQSGGDGNPSTFNFIAAPEGASDLTIYASGYCILTSTVQSCTIKHCNYIELDSPLFVDISNIQGGFNITDFTDADDTQLMVRALISSPAFGKTMSMMQMQNAGPVLYISTPMCKDTPIITDQYSNTESYALPNGYFWANGEWNPILKWSGLA